MVKKIAYTNVYINVMELLVADEVERQFNKLPERVSRYVKRSEVETFALNRLPTLYASSEKGLQHQLDRAHQELKLQIESAVSHAIAAVQVDPIRISQPVHIESTYGREADAVLQLLSEWMRSPNLTWETALQKIQHLNMRSKARAKAARAASQASSTSQTTLAQRHGTIPPPPVRPSRHQEAARRYQEASSRYQEAQSRHRQAFSHSTIPAHESAQAESQAPHEATPSSQTHSTARRPGTYGVRTSWKPRQQSSESPGGFEDTYLR